MLDQPKSEDVPPLPPPDIGLEPRVRTRVPIPVRPGQAAGWFNAEVATFEGLRDRKEHLALLFRGWSHTPTVRLHSECLTGDVFGSARCDCGPQLHEAMNLMQDGGGIILYLRQEGRGIGLYNKLDAYRLQDQGLDTFAANRWLNFRDDQRDYFVAAQMLLALGVRSVRLLTNNSDKASQLQKHGIRVVEIVRTGLFANDSNRRYLKSKRDIAGHDFGDVADLV